MNRFFGWVIALVCGTSLLLTFTVQAAADFYNCFEACALPVLESAADCVKGRDYDISISNAGARVTVLSFHGGNIELHTSAISAALAERYRWNRYDFAGHGSPSCLGGMTNFEKLHITATNFNDDQAVSLVSAAPKAVAIHGYAASRRYSPGVICVGGLDVAARKAFIADVQSKSATWTAYALMGVDASSARRGETCDGLTGIAANNLVNRTSDGRGLQLELSPSVRTDLANSDPKYDVLRSIVYGAIERAMSAL